MYGDADLDVMLGDVFTSTLTHQVGGAVVDVPGILEAADQDLAAPEGDIVGLATSFLCRTAAAQSIALESAVTVDGVSYVLRDRRRVDDGALTRLYLTLS